MKKILICITLFSFIKVFSQKIDGICNVTDKIGYSITNVSVEFYKNNTYIKKRYNKFSEVTNFSPEELLKSHISAQNNKWLSYNFGKKVNWEYDKIRSLLNDNNYLELLFKLTFEVLGKEYSIVKLNAKSKGSDNSIPIVFLMQKNDKKWFFTDEKILQSIKLIFYLLPLEDIYCLFNNEKGNNDELNILLDKVWSNKSFNFYTFISGFGKYLLKNESMDSDKLNLKEGYIKRVKNNGIIPLLNQEFCFYFKNEISEMDKYFINKAISSIPISSNEKITPLNSIKVTIGGQSLFYLKYNSIIDNTMSDSHVRVFDEKFNIINKNDAIFNLLKLNNQEKLKKIFLESEKFFIYD